MNEDDRRLIMESTAEMRELKGEMKTFKEFVLERIRKIEERAESTRKDHLTIVGLAISTCILVFNIAAFLLR